MVRSRECLTKVFESYFGGVADRVAADAGTGVDEVTVLRDVAHGYDVYVVRGTRGLGRTKCVGQA